MNTPQQRDLTLGTAHLVQNAIGRGEEIKQLHTQLCQSTRPLVVTGVGGLGKTTFAQMYWQQHRAEYGYAAWLSCAVLSFGQNEFSYFCIINSIWYANPRAYSGNSETYRAG